MAAIIELHRVTKTFGHAPRPALDDVSLRIERGEFVLLMGPSGAGKSTLLSLIMAMEQPDSGTIRVAGRDVHRLTRASIPYLRRNLGAVFQDFKLLPEATPLENVRLSLQVLGLRRRDVVGRAREALARVGIEPNLRKPVRCMSGGEQQRVALARALAGRPPILLADEPTGNLDPALTRDILRALELIRAAGTTIVLATHDPMVYRHVAASRVLQLDAGRLLEDRVLDRVPNFVVELDAYGEPIDLLAAVADDEFSDEPLLADCNQLSLTQLGEVA
jgi:cell division transport system ATP-binding protein